MGGERGVWEILLILNRDRPYITDALPLVPNFPSPHYCITDF